VSQYQATGDTGFDQVIVRRLQTPGGSVAPGVAPELFGNLTIENDRPEWEYLKNGGLYSRGVVVSAGGAGTRSSLTLCNPAGSNQLVVVKRLDWAVASGQARLHVFRLQGVLPFGAQNLFGVTRDARRQLNGNVSASQSVVVGDNTLGVAGGNALAFLPSTSSFDQPVVLPPDSALYFAPSADNVAITYCTLSWTERPLNRSEL
jgi:hypothetical protein